MSDRATYYHNKGEQDAANHEYNPPIGVFRAAFATQQDLEDQESYDAGYENGRNQR